jgi:acetyltransferase
MQRGAAGQGNHYILREKTMQADRLKRLFKPESVALFGASNVPGKLGTVVLNNLKSAGYKGALTLINPKYDELDGQPCFANLGDAGGAVDTAIIVAPAGVS